MNVTVRLNETELKNLITEWLTQRGMKVSGQHAFTFRHDAGDMREPGAGTSVSVEVTMPDPTHVR